MTSPPDLPTLASLSWKRDDLLWQHRALCGLALPLRAPRGAAWSRDAGGFSVAMGADEPAGDEAPPLPAGRGLRLALIAVFSASLRAASSAAEIGPDAAALAQRLGLDGSPARVRDLGEQVERLAGARLRVGEGRGGALSVLDARRLGVRGGATGWRPMLHLSARFFASLQASAIALDRGVVAALAGSASALDAYTWLAATLPGTAADRPALFSWGDLQQRFGQGGPAEAAAFRVAFAESLDAVRAAWPAGRVAVGDEGVELRGVEPRSVTAPTVAAVTASVETSALPEELEAAPEPDATEVEAAIVASLSTPDADEMPGNEAPAPEPPPVAEEVEPPAPEPPRPAPPPPAPEPPREARPVPEWEQRNGGRIRLAPVLTGLGLSVWLRRGGDEEDGATIEVTPGADYNPARRSLLIIEPVVLQVVGTLQPRELDQVAAWAVANADLIQDYWDGSIASVFDVAGRVKQVPAASRW
jgi:hypothetical protein